MLNLTRKEGQSLYIILEDGRKIEVNARRGHGREIKFSISAPRTINVVREEILFPDIKQEQIE